MKEIEITVPVNLELSKKELFDLVARAMGITPESVSEAIIVRRSLDARGKNVLYRLKVEGYKKGEEPTHRYKEPTFRNVREGKRVVIIGAGPAGLFAALKLIERGYKPVILERGKDVHQRKADIAKLSREQVVNPDSNYCFGEGGAGTYSDGKLYTRSNKRGDIYEVLNHFVFFGADKSILIDAHPHIGTDRLSCIIENMRHTIVEHGGEYHFNSRVVDFIVEGDLVKGVKCIDGEEYYAEHVILATGHSARDIYRLFSKNGWKIESKGFALGVRIEHPQSFINKIQYHGLYQPYMPAAEYSQVAQIEGRGVFSFCMCPGGILVPASTSSGELVLNGMSNSARNSKWANAGVVVSVEPSDVIGYEKYGELALMEFQSDIEKAAFLYGGGNIKAPAQRMTDFLKGKLSSGLPQTSYHPGVVSARLDEILPGFITTRLKQALYIFDRRMRGYITPEALMLAVESRTSSPVRITRDTEKLHHQTLKNLYPCGEGAGYAGGIVSSALDGINVAKQI
ncbi:MAG: FAD-dependent oxidoreductase [Bacteroidales bacterium]|nr:FAD-dependent oxidoreductase [Bacteroidales bacterium]